MRCALAEDVASAAPLFSGDEYITRHAHRVATSSIPIAARVHPRKEALASTHARARTNTPFTSRTLKASTSSSEKPFFLNRAGAVSRAEGWCPAVGGICVVGAAAAGAVWKNSSEMVWIAGGKSKRKGMLKKSGKGVCVSLEVGSGFTQLTRAVWIQPCWKFDHRHPYRKEPKRLPHYLF